MESKYITLEQAAARLGCSLTTIWRRMKAGKLPTTRIFGRLVVLPTDVDAIEYPKKAGRPATREASNG